MIEHIILTSFLTATMHSPMESKAGNIMTINCSQAPIGAIVKKGDSSEIHEDLDCDSLLSENYLEERPKI